MEKSKHFITAIDEIELGIMQSFECETVLDYSNMESTLKHNEKSLKANNIFDEYSRIEKIVDIIEAGMVTHTQNDFKEICSFSKSENINELIREKDPVFSDLIDDILFGIKNSFDASLSKTLFKSNIDVYNWEEAS